MDCETVLRENIAERYLAGKLDLALKEQWEQHYFGCDRCAGQLEIWQTVEQPLREMAASIRQEMGPRKSSARWLWVGAAIAAALMVGLGIKLTSPSNQLPPASETAHARPPASGVSLVELARLEPPAYQPATLRSAGSKAEIQFQKAMESYVRGDYSQTIVGLRAALDLDANSAAARFFLGACELLTGNAADSVRELGRVAAGDSPFAQEAQFDLAKAYLLQGNADQARATLRRLADVPGDFRQQASQLLTRLPAVP